MSYQFTSESVSMGHPDKVADQISDAVLDAMLAQDPNSRVACETMVSTGMAIVAGEVRTEAYVEIPDIVRSTIQRIGYTSGDMAFDHVSCAVLSSIKAQSPDIAMGVDSGNKGEEGAGDQGMMFGFACTETPEFMPLPIQLAHQLVAKHAEVRRSNAVEGLRPDAKSQVTFEYDEENKPTRLDTVVLSTQHAPKWSTDQKGLAEQILANVIKPVVGDLWNDDIKVHINPTGKFEIGGPHGDVGLTGRKIIVDTYGGRGRHGGGAFSGKDPTKVDRSAAYAARYLAKNVVAAGLAQRCTIQLAYAIGVSEPLAVYVDLHGTGKVSETAVEKACRQVMNLTPRGIREHLKLNRPIYARTAAYGHFGRGADDDGGFSWEKLDLVDELKSIA